MVQEPSNTESISTLKPTSIEKILAYARLFQYKAGQTIFFEGLDCAGLFIVKEGMVRIYRISPEGRMHTLGLLKPPASFNEVAAVDGQINPYNAVAVTQAQIYRLNHLELNSLLAKDDQLMVNYLQMLAHLNREYIERLEDMTFRSIPSRIAKLLLHEASYADQIAGAPTKLTQQEMASILGTTREVVGRALRGLLNAGLLKRKGRELYIVDRMGLEHLALTNLMPEIENHP
ncbi:Crp/Fnr family transcriptional regulator [Anaerolineales bacterium]